MRVKDLPMQILQLVQVGHTDQQKDAFLVSFLAVKMA